MSPLQFSRRTQWEIHQNPLTQLHRRLQVEGKRILDWTISNPTRCSFAYDREAITRGLTHPSIFTYAPDPAGALAARQHLAEFLRIQQPAIRPERLLLTASSSEAYSHLFRLLCNPGESVVVPKPGYPLCDDLAQLNDLALQSYRMYYAGSWHVDEKSVRQAITSSTRALVVIHPNNPTGNFLSVDEQTMIGRIAREYGLAIIADEVFLAFPFDKERVAQSCAHIDAPLVFTLNGLSKFAGLPQMKLGWIAVHGDDEWAARAVERLEMIADTYLSVNTPVQTALPEILCSAAGVGEQIRLRVGENYKILRQEMAGTAVSVLHAEAGWNAILQLPRIRTDEEWALHLLQRNSLLVYPGHFFDLETDGCIVVSLLPEADAFRKCCAKLLEILEEDGRNG
jgi:alanine-synthesizing transaminase